MTAQIRNSEMANLLRGDYFARNEPNASWVHYQSAILSTTGLQGFWPMSAIHNDTATGNIYARDIATDHDLQCVNTPTFGYLISATETALPPWSDFVAASSQNMTFGADDNQHDLLGTETYISANERGITVGGWFKFSSIPLSAFGLITKYYRTGAPINQASWRLNKSSTNQILFGVSPNGTAASEITVSSTEVVVADTWYHCVGRLDPSTNLTVFVDGVPTVNAVNPPASAFNSNEPLIIGCFNRVSYFDGKASMCHINAAHLSNSIISALWEQSRVMYGKGG